MRFIVLRSVIVGSQVELEALVSLTQKASSIEADWIKFQEARINFVEPEKCNLLSFDEDEKDEMEENFEIWGFESTIAFIGVPTPELFTSVTSPPNDESQES